MSGERQSMPSEKTELKTKLKNDAPWILLRGLARESRHWGDFPEQLSQALGVEVLCPDTPGNGKLNGETSPLSISATLERVREEIGHRTPVNLLGLSMGGMIATEWARLYPPEVRALVLVNSSFGNFSPPWKRLWSNAFLTLMGSLRLTTEQREARVFDLICQHPEDRQTRVDEWVGYSLERPLSPSNFARQLAAAARFRAPAQAPVASTLVINGLGDRLVNPDCSAAIARRWGVELRSHPSAGHDLTHDAGEWVISQIEELAAKGRLSSGR